MISFEQKGDFSKLTSFLNNLKGVFGLSDLDKYGKRGVDALASATPYDTGNTAGSWYYKINREGTSVSIEFCNSNVNQGVPIAIILQYGHGTGTGGWIEGRDYINPTIQPIFDEILNDVWKEVCK
jgi:hypothetical protein